VSAAARSRRAWGWHPLVDEWAARIVADAGIRPGELVLDIGAGRGALTAHLVATGARVLALELHPGRAQTLRERFGDGVTVVCADVERFRWPRRPFRVVASPPFGLSSAVLRALLAPGSQLRAADLILQRAVVRRYATGQAPGAGRWARAFAVHAGRPLPRWAFQPPPTVDSAVLVIRRRGHGG
jgi:23S rRNA (adenine-N6)-dimethyltransferase